MQERFADASAIDFELGMAMTLEPFDDDEIDGSQLQQHVTERRLRFVFELVDDGPAPARYHRDLGGAGAAMQPGILARLVGIEFMMRVLDRRNFEAALDQHRD